MSQDEQKLLSIMQEMPIETSKTILDQLIIPPKNKADLAKNILILRQTNDVSQVELASIFGVSQSAVANWENPVLSTKVPPAYAVMLLSTMFDVSVDTFVLEGTKIHEVVHNQIKYLLGSKLNTLSTYQIRDLLQGPTRTSNLEAKVSQLEVSNNRLEQTVSLLMLEFKSLKGQIRSQSSNNTPIEDRFSLVSSFLFDQGYPVDDSSHYKAMFLSEPCLLIDSANEPQEKTLAIFEPCSDDISSLENCKVVVKDEEGRVSLKEIQMFRGRYQAYSLTTSGEQVLTNLDSSITILGKLVLVLKMA